MPCSPTPSRRFVPYLGFAGVLLTQLELDPKLRELAILLVAARTGAEYEWVQHVGISRALGIDDAQIDAVAARRSPGRLPGSRRRRCCFASPPRCSSGHVPDDETFAALSDRFPPRQIVELLLVIGNYHMLARIMTTLDIDIDPAVGSAVIDEAHRRLATGNR